VLKEPAQLGDLRPVRLDEDGASLWIKAQGDEGRRHLESLAPQHLRIVDVRQGVVVHDAVDRLIAILESHVVPRSRQVVAQVGPAGRLDAAVDARLDGRLDGRAAGLGAASVVMARSVAGPAHGAGAAGAGNLRVGAVAGGVDSRQRTLSRCVEEARWPGDDCSQLALRAFCWCGGCLQYGGGDAVCGTLGLG